MKIRALALGLAAVFVIACGTSGVADDANVTVSGVIQLPDGSPASGITVGLMEEPGGIDALFELALTVSSVGMLCLTQQVALCQGARRTKTDSEGRYSFTLAGKETKSILGNPARFAVSARLDSGPQIQTRFSIDDSEVQVPAARFWQPAELRVTAGPRWVEYSWPPVKDAKHRFEVTAADELVWAQESKAEGKLDARAIADTRGDFRAVAHTDRDGFATDLFSQPVPAHGQAGAPPSRGAACETPNGPCPFTDGRYSGTFPTQICPSASPPASKCDANRWITIDLGRAQDVSAVFLHGLGSSVNDIEVKTSTDGVQWSSRTRQKVGTHAILPIEPATAARYVRIQHGTGFSSLQEASVWGISGAGSR